ncbi:MAG: aldose epimerase [Patescibacteria group bacterium]
MEYEYISSETQRLTFSHAGGQVVNWEIRQNQNESWTSLLYQGSSLKRSGIPILFPFANPLQNNIFNLTGREIGQHGFGRNCAWKIVKNSEQDACLILTDSMIPQEMQLAYPFQFKVEISLRLTATFEFSYSLNVYNLSNKIMPIAPGLHPYFNVNHNLKSDLRIPQIENFKAESFKWDSKLSGDFYNFPNKVSVEFPEDYIINISDTSNNYKYLVVWSQGKLEQDYNFVCFEPFSRFTNAINDDPILILPDKHCNSELVFEYTKNI